MQNLSRAARLLLFAGIVWLAARFPRRQPGPLPPHSLRGGYPFKGPI